MKIVLLVTCVSMLAYLQFSQRDEVDSSKDDIVRFLVNWNKVEKGMARSQVEDLLGPHSSVVLSNGESGNYGTYYKFSTASG